MLQSYITRVIQQCLICLLSGTGMLSVSVFSFENGTSMLSKLTPTKEQFKKWHESESVALRDGKNKLICLNFEEYNNAQTDITLSINQKSNLRDIINWSLEAFCAKDFDEFNRAMKKIAKEKLGVTIDGRRIMRFSLQFYDAIRRPESLTDYELVEAYWLLISKNGYLNRHFVGLIPKESFYKLERIQNSVELEAIPDPFPKDRIICGLSLRHTSFSWSGSDPRNELEKRGELLVVDIRYMIKTSVKNLAYPVCIRMYWSETFATWIPWFCIEYNVSEHYCSMVF